LPLPHRRPDRGDGGNRPGWVRTIALQATRTCSSSTNPTTSEREGEQLPGPRRRSSSGMAAGAATAGRKRSPPLGDADQQRPLRRRNQTRLLTQGRGFISAMRARRPETLTSRGPGQRATGKTRRTEWSCSTLGGGDGPQHRPRHHGGVPDATIRGSPSFSQSGSCTGHLRLGPHTAVSTLRSWPRSRTLIGSYRLEFLQKA